MGSSLREARWAQKCAGATDPHADAEVKAWFRMSNGIGKLIAHACHVSVSRVHNWTCGEQPSPLAQLRRAIDAALDAGQPVQDATAPVELLCERYLVRVDASTTHPQIRLVHSAGLALDRVAEAVQVALASVADGVVDEHEIDQFDEVLRAARTELEVLRLVMQREAETSGAPAAAIR